MGGVTLAALPPVLVFGQAPRVGLVGSVSYRIQVASDSAFGAIVASATVGEQGGQTSFSLPGSFPTGARYYWRVQAFSDKLTGPWSAAGSFVTPAPGGGTPPPSPPPTGGGSSGSCASTDPDYILECIKRTYPSKLAPTATLDQRKANMAYVRDRIIEAGICDGRDFGWNLKRGGPDLSYDFIVVRESDGYHGIDIARDYDNNERYEEADSFFAPQGHEYLLLIAKEITELKRQQEQMRVNSLRALVSEQEKLGAVRETISAAIFQLRGPLNMLNAAMGMESRRLGERNECSTPLFNALHSAVAAGSKAVAVLEGSLPRLLDEPLVPLNINQVLRDALGITTERLLAEGIIIDWRPSPVLPVICGYENQLLAMFKQLIDNAVDALDGQTPLERSLMLSTMLRDDEVCITIDDSGSGTAEENLLKVFEPFFTTRSGGDHTGMGLAMVQETVNRHAGVLRLTNRDEGGCRVLICLPVSKPQLCKGTSQEQS